jgi:UDP-N-acetylmuramoylalanine--D-glutamate ligase
MKHPAEYRGRDVVILGLAKSGQAAAKLFHQLGAKVTVNDKKERHLCPEADELEALGISVICGSHPEHIIHPEVALAVKNPGIPYSAPPLRQAAELGIEIVTEVEVAWHICKAPIIGITGSNGKTTTTTWVWQMMEEAKLHPIIAGNIGRALCDAALEATEDNWMVVELSSFQLKGTSQFRPAIACLLNIYETHLDYHGSMDDYVESKYKLFYHQTAEDTAVLNWDQDVCRRLKDRIKSRIIPFAMEQDLETGVFLNNGVITYRDQTGTAHSLAHVKELGVPGLFNAENALAAAAVAIAAGVPLPAIAKALRSFRGVEHRLEFVASKRGVDFYNNSKATNPAATAKALETFDRSVVLIAGGLDRADMDFGQLKSPLQRHVKAVVSLGETKMKIQQIAQMAGITRTKAVDTGNSAQETLALAVQEAVKFADEGDVVLLSPACASWDMFSSFEERGRMFKETVHNL